MGGDSADVADISTNPDMINALCDVAAGGGGGSGTYVIATVSKWSDETGSGVSITLPSDTNVNPADAVAIGSYYETPTGMIIRNTNYSTRISISASNYLTIASDYAEAESPTSYTATAEYESVTKSWKLSNDPDSGYALDEIGLPSKIVFFF